MKKNILLCCLLMAIILPIFASCKDPSENTTKTEGEGWYKDLDFEKEEIIVSQSIYNSGTNVYGAGALDNSAKYTMGPTEYCSDTVRNLCFERNRSTKNELNLVIKYSPTNFNSDEIIPYVEKSAMQSKAPFDLIINDMNAIPALALNSHLYNICSTLETNYFNFSDQSWYIDFMRSLSVDNNKLYGLAGDYFIDVLRAAHCLYINTTIYESQCASSSDATIKEFYDIVANGEWDYDMLEEMAGLGWYSSGNNPKATLEDNSVGLVLVKASGLLPFFSTSGVSVLEKDTTGKYQIAENPTIVSDMANRLYDLATHRGVIFGSATELAEMRDLFVSNHILFLSGFWLGDLEYDSFMGMENKAPVVYPKYLPENDYRTYVDESAEIGYILCSTEKFTPLSAYLQVLSEKSTSITERYFDYALKYKYGTQSDALAMMDIIRESISSSTDYTIGKLYLERTTSNGKGCSMYSLCEYWLKNEIPGQAASDYAGYIDIFKRGITNLYTKFNSLQ